MKRDDVTDVASNMEYIRRDYALHWPYKTVKVSRDAVSRTGEPLMDYVTVFVDDEKLTVEPLGTYAVYTDGGYWNMTYPYKLVEKHERWNKKFGDTKPLTLEEMTELESPLFSELVGAKRKEFLERQANYYEDVLRMYGMRGHD